MKSRNFILKNNNKINNFFLKNASRLSGASDDFLDLYIEESEIKTRSSVNSEKDLVIAKTAIDFLDHLGFKRGHDYIGDIVKKSRGANIKNSNDCYYFIFKSILEKEMINKKAYPSVFAIPNEGLGEEYDLNKWADLVHKVYSAVNSGDMSYLNAVDYYSGFLESDKESFSFKKWIEYYKSGEHKKYSLEEVDMKKKANMPVELISGLYHDTPTIDHDQIAEISGTSMALKENYKKWKGQFNAALRRIDRLLRGSEEYVDPETYESLADDLHTLSKHVNRVRMSVTASDLAIRTANKFEKRGFSEGADILRKFAQDVPPDVDTAGAPPQQAAAAPAPEPEAPAAAAEQQEEPEPEPADIRDIKPIPGPASGEYEQLAGNINLTDASTKLEEVAGMLADRRVIRLLAEFDIMLDKLGIASMFPELAESQAKLIDSYGYALTRVSKMLGMISSSNKLVEMAGQDDAAEEQPEGAAVEETVQPEGQELGQV